MAEESLCAHTRTLNFGCYRAGAGQQGPVGASLESMGTPPLATGTLRCAVVCDELQTKNFIGLLAAGSKNGAVESLLTAWSQGEPSRVCFRFGRAMLGSPAVMSWPVTSIQGPRTVSSCFM